MDCEVCTAATGDTWLRMVGGHRRHLVDNNGQIGGGYSQDSEHDLSVMVRDFLESGSSSGTDSDGEAGLSDLAHVADRISFYKHSGDDREYENELASVINSLILSVVKETDLHLSSPCKAASCLRFYLVKLLRLSGYNAAVCVSKWRGNGKNVPGGDHEYIDIIKHGDDDDDDTERLIVEIDFQSHFEIARAVESYNRILKSLPVVYVGSFSKLKQLLVLMVEAARSSLNQNSMPLPPWRSLGYLLAKWQSPHRRYLGPDQGSCGGAAGNLQHHEHCRGHLKRLRSLILLEIDVQRLLKPMNANTHPRLKCFERPI